MEKKDRIITIFLPVKVFFLLISSFSIGIVQDYFQTYPPVCVAVGSTGSTGCELAAGCPLVFLLTPAA